MLSIAPDRAASGTLRDYALRVADAVGPDGTFTTQQVGPGVNPITISDDGRLFVARVFMGDGLHELNPELVEPPRVVIEDLVGMNGMDFGPDGLL